MVRDMRAKLGCASRGELRLMRAQGANLPTKVPALMALILTLFWGSSCFAQASDSALAEELFRQAKSLMEKEQYSEACSKFQESQRLDPATGTLINLANCHEKAGKFASAWTEYTEVVLASRRENRPERVEYAEARLKELEPKVSKLVIVLPEENDVKGLKVALNGTDVGRPAWGIPLPVDAGETTLEISAPGKVSVKKQIAIKQGAAQQNVVIPALKDAPKGMLAGETPEETQKRENRENRRLAGYVIGATGILGLGVGSVLGIVALNKLNKSNELGCVDNDCPPEAASVRTSARGYGDGSTAAIIAGGVLTAGGALLVLTAREPKERGPEGDKPPTRAQLKVQANHEGGFLSLQGVF